MKTVETQVRSMDDLIFENRNHEYGAYAVRKAYAGSVNRATAVTLGLAAAITAWSFIKREVAVEPPLPVPNHPTEFLDQLTVIPELQQRTRPTQQIQRRGDLPPVATADPIETVEPVEMVAYQAGTNTEGEGEFVDGPITEGVIAEVEPIAAVVEDKVWLHTEVAAQYKGGMEAMVRFISKNMKYPSIARRMNIEGTVYVSFIVGKAGEILETTVIKGIDAACDAEAIRVINLMKNWSPGLQGGSPVKVRMVLPITFKLQSS
jgi:protein TonB